MRSIFKISAVLVLITKNLNDGNLILTRRSEKLKRHGGEISFPGGVRDSSDYDLKETALRETFEEINVKRDQVDIIATLPDTSTSTGYLIRPYVAILETPYAFGINYSEVSDIVEIPMPALIEGHCDRTETVLLKNNSLVKRPLYVYEGNVVYGATARIMTNLLTTIKIDY